MTSRSRWQTGLVPAAAPPPLPAGPMLPSPGAPPRGDHWTVELKADGARAMTAVHGGEVRIRSRPGNSLSSRFPDVTAAVSAVFDGDRKSVV